MKRKLMCVNDCKILQISTYIIIIIILSLNICIWMMFGLVKFASQIAKLVLQKFLFCLIS